MGSRAWIVALALVVCCICSVSSFRAARQSHKLFQISYLLAKNKAEAKSENINHKNEENVEDARQEALEGVMHSIDKSYGKGSIQKLGDAHLMNIETFSSGAITLDIALGGGYPRGRVIEIYGPESSGKTTLAFHAVAAVQQNGGSAAYIDAEHAVDPLYAAKLGVHVKDLLICQPDNGEMALDVCDQLIRSAAVDIIVIDSVAALVPKAELEGEMGEMQMGLQARLMSKALRKITGSLSKSQCTVIFINQLRSKIGVIFGNPEVTAGGNSLKFYSSVRLDIRRREVLKDGAGIGVRVKVIKNKVAPPFKIADLDILFGSGIDKYGSLLDAAENYHVISRRGAYYNYGDIKLGQGRAQSISALKGNETMTAQILNEVKKSVSSISPVPPQIAVDSYDMENPFIHD